MTTVAIAQDTKTDEPIGVDISRSRAIFITGKRGSGKSYTLGKIIEQVHDVGRHLVVVVDPLSVFWATCVPTNGSPPIPVNVLVPGSIEDAFGILAPSLSGLGVTMEQLKLNPSDLSQEAWLRLLGVTLSDAQGISLTRALRGVSKTQFTIAQLIEQVQLDELANKRTVEAVVNRLDGFEHLGIFGNCYKPLQQSLREDAVNVLDIFALDAGPHSIRNLAVELLVSELFKLRLQARRQEQLGQVGCIKPIFLALDEAHNFCPKSGNALGKNILIRWVKEGRASDMSIVMATQEPAAIDYSFANQCGVRIFHVLTADDDVKVASRLAGRYSRAVAPLMKGIEGAGRAIIIDDTIQRATVGQILPRQAVHGADSIPLPPATHKPQLSLVKAA